MFQICQATVIINYNRKIWHYDYETIEMNNSPEASKPNNYYAGKKWPKGEGNCDVFEIVNWCYLTLY